MPNKSNNTLNTDAEAHAVADLVAHGFSHLLPFSARCVGPGEWIIENQSGSARFHVEGAAFAEWVTRALNQYDKCLDTIEAHLDNCYGCESDSYEWNEAEGDNDTIPCATCDQLEDLVLVRHNAEVEIRRASER